MSGKRKMNAEEKRKSTCFTLKPELIEMIAIIAEDRIMAMSKVVEICLTTTTTVDALMKGLEVKTKFD